MGYEQLPLGPDKPLGKRAWVAMGYAIFFCPGCGGRVSYPANTNMYSVVCKCGFFTMPGDNGTVFWYPPAMAEEAIKARFAASDNRN